MTIEIRPYEATDWDAIARIHDLARLEELRRSVGVEAFLSLEETAEREGLFAGEVLVALSDGAIAGFGTLDADEVTWLYVDPNRARTGIGRSLLRHLIERGGDRIEASVLAGNDPAILLYESEGFVIQETKTGRLVGNEAFHATGHVMVLQKGTGGIRV
ncbi:MAG: GNAT family N-acetyltransferase [Actinomycetota bacterium]|nr:GNAT family N-acetyltransferase [Actinomycetota bacterium]